jgi:hypothetical protein
LPQGKEEEVHLEKCRSRKTSSQRNVLFFLSCNRKLDVYFLLSFSCEVVVFYAFTGISEVAGMAAIFPAKTNANLSKNLLSELCFPFLKKRAGRT